MRFFKTCTYCGAHLDPGETCECRYEHEHKEVTIKKDFHKNMSGGHNYERGSIKQNCRGNR